MNYQKIYDNLIQKAKSENRKKLNREDKDFIYYELHHIIPKCLGGNNSKENLVLLTAREHFIAHKLLVEIYPKDNYGLILGYLMMGTIKRGSLKGRKELLISSREYERIRIKISELFSKRFKGVSKPIGFGEKISKRMLGDNNPSRKYGPPNKNIPWSSEIKEKISKIHKENKTFAGNKNSRYKPIDEKLWEIICSDLESGSDIKFVSFLNRVSVDRIIRNLYFKGMILYEDLPNYIRNYTNPESFGILIK